MKTSDHVGKDRSQQLRKFRCPTCKRIVKLSEQDPSAQMKFFPFCSERCRLIDLGAWLDADYRIPAQADDESESPSKEDSPTPREHS
jgi:endogenous inhibitor of DNA gyrase (YacG/DUF329 family)